MEIRRLVVAERTNSRSKTSSRARRRAATTASRGNLPEGSKVTSRTTTGTGLKRREIGKSLHQSGVGGSRVLSYQLSVLSKEKREAGRYAKLQEERDGAEVTEVAEFTEKRDPGAQKSACYGDSWCGNCGLVARHVAVKAAASRRTPRVTLGFGWRGKGGEK